MKKLKIETTDKNSLRKIYLRFLKKISRSNHQKWSKIICQKFTGSHYFKQNQVFAIYNALPHEVATKELIEALWNNAKVVCLPRINDQDLDFYIINSWQDVVIDNKFKIGQPLLTCQKVVPTEIDCMLIPMVAFDEDYYRIGYGKGFYDRYLTKNSLNFNKIGLAFLVQKIPYAMKHDSWDVPLDFVFTN